jgi:DNA-binding transcriptional regulator PaaX
MSIEREVLQYLSDNREKRISRYKGVRIGLFGLPDFKYYKYQTLANRCSELKRKGYIKEVNGEYLLTFKGEDFLNKKTKNNFKKFEPNKTKDDPKNLLLLYDIPQDKTAERNWFRRELIKFHFIMIQKSVWVGPSPLPQDFIAYVKEIDIEDKVKTFKLEKGYKLEN